MNDALAALAATARADAAAQSHPARPWVKRPAQAPGDLHDVVVVGGGQSALGVAFGLKREGISGVVCLDAAAAGAEGPWLGYARMATLRTPKELVGLEYGQPSLGFRAWHEARYGAGAWDAMARIPRTDWAAYLDWYRRTTDADVRNGTRVRRIEPAAHGFDLRCDGPSGPALCRARRVVLATGFEGSGAWEVPDHVRRALAPERYAHSNGPIDPARVAGKRVAILGHGASAFDNAVWALDNGAASVDICFRRAKLPEINPHRWAEFAGFLDHFHELPDALRWKLSREFRIMDQPPTKTGVDAATARPNCRIRPGADWIAVREADGAVRIDTPKGALEADFLICATGLVTDLSRREELAAIADGIARWADRYTPPPGEEHDGLAAAPYLGPHLEFTERVPGTAPFLSRLFCFSYAAGVSHGGQCASISGHRYALPRLVRGIVRGFFLDQAETLLPDLAAYDEREVLLPAAE
jgi:cation diffusion facilitator CzcD-associated flavoprotein CzcO